MASCMSLLARALKVMSREVQIAYAAAHLAWEDAGLSDAKPDPDRMGVVYGSEMIPGDHAEVVEAVLGCATNGQFDPSLLGQNYSKIFPLWMLRNLPNMPACHVAIAIDARGPNNTIVMEEVSGLLALSEAICIMQRDHADLMVVGAMGLSQLLRLDKCTASQMFTSTVPRLERLS